jgi:hypothetical protein
MATTDKRKPACFEGWTVKQIETFLVARQVDRVFRRHAGKPEAIKVSRAMVKLLDFPTRDLLNTRRR